MAIEGMWEGREPKSKTTCVMCFLGTWGLKTLYITTMWFLGLVAGVDYGDGRRTKNDGDRGDVGGN